MATGAVIGSLRVVIGADSAALDKGMKQAQSSMRAFASDISKIAAGVGLERIIEKSVEALVGGVKHALTAADDLGKAAQKIGLPVEELSKLKFAADLADVSFEALSKGLVKFDKGLAEASVGVKNDLTAALSAMKIEIRDSNGEVKSQSQLLGEIADKFASYEDGIEKTGLAVQTFGKRFGPDLIPLLNEGSKGLVEAGLAAERTGNVIDTNTAAASQRFNDNIKILTANTEGFTNAVARGAIPTLTRFSDALVASQGGAEKFNNVTKITEAVMKGISTVALLAADGIMRFASIWVALGQSVGAVSSGEFSRAADIMKNLGVELKGSLIQSAVGVRQVFGELVPATIALEDGMTGLGDAVAKTKAPFKDVSDQAKNALQTFLDSTAKTNEGRQVEIETVGLVTGALERERVTRTAALVAKQNQIPIDAAMTAQIKLLGDEAARTALQLKGQQLVFENLDPLVRYETELANAEAAMRSVGATSEQIAREQEKVAEKFGMSWSAVGQNIAGTAGSLSRLTATFAKENKAMGIASKAFGISEAIINTQIAITKALATLPPPASYAAVALAVASGAAAVATIASQGFAQGGSFRVPGGMSSTDNMMVPLNLAAGERVDITPASQASGPGSSITVDMRGGDPYYSRGHVEKLLDAMHTVMSDGHQVRLVVLR